MVSVEQLKKSRDKLTNNQELIVEDCIHLLIMLDKNMLSQEETTNAVEAINTIMAVRWMSFTAKNDVRPKWEKYDYRLFTRVRRQIGNYRLKLLTLRMAEKSAARLIKYWPEAFKRLSNLVRREKIWNESRIGRTREIAKLMSVNQLFQSNLALIRKQQGIIPKYPEASANTDMNADDILIQYAFENVPYSNKTWYQLQRTMEKKLCTPFKDFIWRLDYGLIVAALCYGLEPQNVLSNWDSIWKVAKHQETFRHVEIRVDDDEKFMGAILTIAYLSNFITQVGQTTLPAAISQWIDFARNSQQSILIDYDDIPQALENISGEPTSPPLGDLTLLVRIYPETTKEDLDSLWPRISLKQLELWGKQQRITQNQWETFESDIFIDNLRQQGKTLQEIAKEHDETFKDKPIGGSSISLELIRDLVKKRMKRFRERQGKTGGAK